MKLGLYMDTLLTGHIVCSMLSILYELTLQKKLQKKVKTQQQQSQKANINCSMQEPGIEPRTTRTTVWCVTSRTPRQPYILTEVSYLTVQYKRSKHK